MEREKATGAFVQEMTSGEFPAYDSVRQVMHRRFATACFVSKQALAGNGTRLSVD